MNVPLAYKPKGLSS